MIRLIHTRSKIPFPNPYVLQVEYPGYPNPDSDTEYNKLTRSTYRKMKGSWGYTELQEDRHDISQVAVSLHMLRGTQAETVKRAYICFESELDALQFRLGLDKKVTHVVMWPSTMLFTIHENIYEDESVQQKT